jgi:hypothetical protein
LRRAPISAIEKGDEEEAHPWGRSSELLRWLKRDWRRASEADMVSLRGSSKVESKDSLAEDRGGFAGVARKKVGRKR